MRIAFTLLCAFLLFSKTLIAQEFTTYTVVKDDTATSLAKKFNTTVEQIYRFNPETKNGLKLGSVLVIPKNTVKDIAKSDILVQERTPQSFKTHKVRRRETLYSLSKKYDVTEDEIKRYNTRLYSEQLKRKDRIRIPVYPDIIISDNQISDEPSLDINETPVVDVISQSDKVTHTVKPKEGKYGISRMYGMTIAELEALNPDMQEPLQPGQVLKVKGLPSQEDSIISDERLAFYEVKPKENFFRLEQRFKISEDSLIALNPALAEGLKAGMIIKVPKDNMLSGLAEGNKINLEDRLVNFERKTIALMLPFNSHKVTNDSLSNVDERIKRDRVMRISLDFYSGAMLAVEDAKRKGLSTTVKVFDTEQSKSKVASIVSNNNFSNVSAVIGPLLNNTVEEASSKLKRWNIPVISPLSSRRANGGSNLVQSRPTTETLEKVMLTYLDSLHESQNIVIIADDKSQAAKNKLKAKFPFASILNPREDNFLYQIDVKQELIDGKDNWFIVATEDVALLSNITSYLNAFASTNSIQLFALEKNSAYESDEVSNYHLSNLKFTYPSVDKEFDEEDNVQFISDYKSKYGIVPNKYAVRGYDLTYDVLLRLASAEDFYKSLDEDGMTEYVENKFSYKGNFSSGYINNGVYIMQYGENLTLKTIEQ